MISKKTVMNMKSLFFNQNGKNHRYIYFIIAGLFLSSFFGILSNDHVKALFFGSDGTSGSTSSIENICVAGYYQMNNHNGIANNITAYISSGLSYSGYAKCKIYYGSNGTALVNGETTSTQITLKTYAVYIFTFINPKPILDADAYYYLTILAQSGTGVCFLVYSNTGTSTTTSKTATYDTFPTAWTSYTNIDTSSTPRIYCNYDDIIPNSPTNLNSFPKIDTSDTISLTWDIGNYATYTRIMYKTSYFPNSISDGTLAYNNTGNSYDLSGLNENTIYFFTAWGYDGTYWSIGNSITCNRTITFTTCNSTTLNVINNTVHTTGNYETSYNNVTGNKIWLNFTGEIPVLTQYSNIINAIGSHEYVWNNTLWKFFDWANYTGNFTSITLINSYVNSSLIHEYILNSTGYYVWANSTGYNGLNITENLANLTGGYVAVWNGTSWLVWNNYTGNIVGCSGIVWVNYSDINLSFNVSIDKATNANTSSYNINEDNWLNLASTLIFDNSQIFLFLLVALWTYFITKCYDLKTIKAFAYMQLGISIPLSISIAIISFTFPFGFVIVFIIPVISIYILVDILIYTQKNEKK